MTGTLRLFTIEARRSVAIWIFPLMVLAACWYATDRLAPLGIALWRHSSAQIGETLIILAPLMGGVAAWVAGRDYRRGMGDLLATTPRPVAYRTLAGWGGLLVWGVLAYAVVGVYVAVVTLRDDAWGSPLAAPVIIGLLTIVAASAIGFLVGSLIPSRFAPPLVPIGLFLAISLLNSGWFLDDPISFLSPWTLLDRQLLLDPDAIFYTPPSLHLWPMALWLSGLTGLALAGIVLARRRGVVVWSVLTCSAIVTTIGAVLLMSAYDDGFWTGVPWERGDLVPYTPVCVERSIPVCVHPVFEPSLAAQADRIDRLIEPLAGLPGAPVRAEQLPSAKGMTADGTLAIDPYGIETAALALVQSPVEPGRGRTMSYNLQPEQFAIAIWMARRIDDQAYMMWGFFLESAGASGDDAIYAAATRFSALEPAEQRAWLETHFADLQAGRLGMSDLP